MSSAPFGSPAPLLLLAAALVLSSACAAAEDSAPSGDNFDGFGDDDTGAADSVGSIRWLIPDAPTLLALDTPTSASVAYGQCQEVPPQDPDTDIEIHCTNAWSEVAWYVIPAQVVAAHLDADQAHLHLSFGISDGGDARVIRASVHEMTSPEKTRKLTSIQTLFDGDTVDVDLRNPLDHYIYVARGRTLLPLWGTGMVEFTIRATFQ